MFRQPYPGAARPQSTGRRRAPNLHDRFRAAHLLVVLLHRRVVPQMVPSTPGVGPEHVAGEITDEHWRRDERRSAALASSYGHGRVNADRTSGTSATNSSCSRWEILFTRQSGRGILVNVERQALRLPEIDRRAISVSTRPHPGAARPLNIDRRSTRKMHDRLRRTHLLLLLVRRRVVPKVVPGAHGVRP